MVSDGDCDFACSEAAGLAAGLRVACWTRCDRSGGDKSFFEGNRALGDRQFGEGKLAFGLPACFRAG